MKYYLRNEFKKILCVCIITVIIIAVIQGVSAASMKKTLNGRYSTTSIAVEATYFTNEPTRWQISNSYMTGSSGKGGGFSKSGGMITSQAGNEYTMKQKYNISATDYNYTTVTGTKTFQWCVNGSTNTWVTSKCKVS